MKTRQELQDAADAVVGEMARDGDRRVQAIVDYIKWLEDDRVRRLANPDAS